MPKLSIVIPVYNVEEYLARCLDSVLCAPSDEYEIIIVNDGSTDASLAVAEEYKARYPEYITVITTENGGLGSARNVGIEAAQGEFLFFLDSDDSLAPGALTEMLAALTPDRDMLIFDFVAVDPEGHVLERMPGCKQRGAVNLQTYPELLMELPSGCNKVCRRTLFTETGIRFPGRVWYEDLRTMPKLYLHTDRIWSVDAAWYQYLMRPGSITKGASVARNLEIIDAVDDLVTYYKQAGCYQKYKEQLDYVAFHNQFLTAIVRVCVAGGDRSLAEQLRGEYLRRYPDFADNPYFQSMSRKHHLLTELMLDKLYGPVGVIMRMSERIKRMPR